MVYNLKQEVTIDAGEVLKNLMLTVNFSLFAVMVADVVLQSDDHEALKKALIRELNKI